MSAPNRPASGGQPTITAERVSAAVTAANSLMQAGVYEGQLQLSPQQAVEAVACVFQLAYGRAAIRTVMAKAAAAANVVDAYEAIVDAAPPRQAQPQT